MKKKLLLITSSLLFILSFAITSYARPQKMEDGTIFDPEFYLRTYPDVAAACGTDAAALYQHYSSSGKAEGREAYYNEKQSKIINIFKISHSIDDFYEYDNGIIMRISNYTSMLFDFETYEKPLPSQYVIQRTDFSDGLLDQDHNGIDDRDPMNGCGYTDLNYNGIADGSSVDLNTVPQEFRWYFSDTESFLGENHLLGYRLCEHNVVGSTTLCAPCIEWMEQHPLHFTAS